MYGRDFEDPDGHHWEPMWMDQTSPNRARIRSSSAMAGARSDAMPLDPTAPIEVTAFRWVPVRPGHGQATCAFAGRSRKPGGDYRVRLLGPAAARRNICSSSRSTRCPASATAGPALRERRDRPIYRRAERALLPRIRRGRIGRSMDLCGAEQRRAGRSTSLLIDVFFAGEAWARGAQADARRISLNCGSSACPTRSATRSGSRATASPSAI